MTFLKFYFVRMFSYTGILSCHPIDGKKKNWFDRTESADLSQGFSSCVMFINTSCDLFKRARDIQRTLYGRNFNKNDIFDQC